MPVFFTMSPVTHVALVAVKRLSVKESRPASYVAIGSESAMVPMHIAQRKLNMTIREGVSFPIKRPYCTFLISALIPRLSVAAISASIFRFNIIPAFLSPDMNLL